MSRPTLADDAAEVYRAGETIASVSRAINCNIYHTRLLLKRAGVTLRPRQVKRNSVIAGIKSGDTDEAIVERCSITLSYVRRLRKGTT